MSIYMQKNSYLYMPRLTNFTICISIKMGKKTRTLILGNFLIKIMNRSKM